MKLRRRTKFGIDPLPPFNFGLTVRKPAGWDLFTSEEVYEDGTLWTGFLFFGKEPENRREAIEEVKQEGIRRWGRWSWMAFFYVAQDLRNLSKRLGIQLRLD